MKQTAAQKKAASIAEGKKMRAAMIARTDWKAVAEDRAKKMRDLQAALDEQIDMTRRVREMVAEANLKRDATEKTVREIAQQREDAYRERHAADSETAVQARRADFWKGVAMGLEPVKASAIAEQQQAMRPKHYGESPAQTAMRDFGLMGKMMDAESRKD